MHAPRSLHSRPNTPAPPLPPPSLVGLLTLTAFGVTGSMNGQFVVNPARAGSAECTDPSGEEVQCCNWELNGLANATWVVVGITMLWTALLAHELRAFVISGAVAQVRACGSLRAGAPGCAAAEARRGQGQSAPGARLAHAWLAPPTPLCPMRPVPPPPPPPPHTNWVAVVLCAAGQHHQGHHPAQPGARAGPLVGHAVLWQRHPHHHRNDQWRDSKRRQQLEYLVPDSHHPAPGGAGLCAGVGGGGMEGRTRSKQHELVQQRQLCRGVGATRQRGHTPTPLPPPTHTLSASSRSSSSSLSLPRLWQPSRASR